MMGIKEREFAPLRPHSLEDLVPADHFYRLLDRVLDLSFVRDLVAPYYAGGGHRSIDPFVFLRLQLVLFFEGVPAVKSVRMTLCCSIVGMMKTAQDRGRGGCTGMMALLLRCSEASPLQPMARSGGVAGGHILLEQDDDL